MKYDALIVGSGFGGSVCARNLTRDGLRVLIVERGPWRDTLPVRSLGIADRAPLPYGLKLLTHGLRNLHAAAGSLMLNRDGMYESFRFRGLDVVCTSSVGGGSHAYAGLLAKPQNPRYWHGRHPQLEPHDVERHYDTVLADLGAVPLTEDLSENNVWRQLAGLDVFRPSLEQPYVGLLFGADRATAQREACRLDGDSFLGSQSGAKATVDWVYLAPALRSGARLRERCEVRRLRREDGGFAVDIHDLRTQTDECLRADRVILAAGALNSLKLLFGSAADGGLSAMPALGSHFGGNTDSVGLWRRRGGRLSSFEAPPCLGRFDYDGRNTPYLVLGAFPGVDSLPLPRQLRNRLRESLAVIAMAADSGTASVRYANGRLRLDYAAAAEPAFAEVQQVFAALARASGTKISTRTRPATVHPWGGASLGADETCGVVDAHGEVYGNPGLYVADGSALPAAPGGPPSLAIAAWAHSVSNRLP
ncbi:MAG: GMC oxidoreductase [Pseudomonadota bacterium]|nr:GMC oxidoreductase [Pseudomonadota bacterium]